VHDSDESGDEVRLHASPLVRSALVAVGTLALTAGVIGAFVPVLPTTPFLLVAAACYARASPGLYRRLAHSKTFGPGIREWRSHRSIPWRTKVFAIFLMSVSIALSAAFFVEPWWGKAALVGIGVAVGTWLYRIPSRDRPGRETGR
jgi:hypothetical protein